MGVKNIYFWNKFYVEIIYHLSTYIPVHLSTNIFKISPTQTYDFCNLCASQNNHLAYDWIGTHKFLSHYLISSHTHIHTCTHISHTSKWL